MPSRLRLTTSVRYAPQAFSSPVFGAATGAASTAASFFSSFWQAANNGSARQAINSRRKEVFIVGPLRFGSGVSLGDQFFLRCHSACSACATAGGTKPDTSPPRRAISRTSEDEMKAVLLRRGQEKVSTSGIRWRFMLASWNSYSKSDTARRPRRITPPPRSRTKCASRQSKPRISTCGIEGDRLSASTMRIASGEGRALARAFCDSDHHPVEQRARRVRPGRCDRW